MQSRLIVTPIVVCLFWVTSFVVEAERTLFQLSPDIEGIDVDGRENQNKLILVAFEDTGSRRKPPPGRYRMRGGYQSQHWNKRVSRQIAEQYQLTELAAWSISAIGMYCIVYQLSDSTTLSQALQEIGRDERLSLVQSMGLYHTQSNRFSDPYFPLQLNIHNIQLENIHLHATGKDISIGLIDTGVDYTHPDLEGQVVKKHNFASDVSPGFFNDLHGTAVAGVMVALANNHLGIVGIAPDAKLIALKSCWTPDETKTDAVCNSFTLAMAINKAIEMNVDVLNMSLSGNQDPLIEKLIQKAIEKGIIIVAAIDEKGTSSSFPALMPEVISVGSHENKTNASANPDISTSGYEILTTIPNATYDFMSGSSFATAQISAVIALILEHQPSLNFNQVNQILAKYKIDHLLQYFEEDNQAEL
ncbi:MAG: S8 family serine peptidase [Gammaproteobacteria bacterium]|nr:S8 family serine peptidase [Gammaproteobacteria bacterium]